MEIEKKGKNNIKEKKCYTIKIIVVGNSGVGKTNIIFRLVNNQFIADYAPTIGVDFLCYNVEFIDKIFKFILMDTAGSEEFKSITRGYYKNCSFALVVYDVTDKKSFNDIKQWIEDCQNYGNKNIYIVLVGNKIDLNEKRKISKEEGEKFAKEHIMAFYETSAKTGENIADIFLGISEILSNNIDEGKFDFNNPSSGVKEKQIEEKEDLKISKNFSLDERSNYSKKYGTYEKEKNKCCNK